MFVRSLTQPGGCAVSCAAYLGCDAALPLVLSCQWLLCACVRERDMSPTSSQEGYCRADPLAPLGTRGLSEIASVTGAGYD